MKNIGSKIRGHIDPIVKVYVIVSGEMCLFNSSKVIIKYETNNTYTLNDDTIINKDSLGFLAEVKECRDSCNFSATIYTKASDTTGAMNRLYLSFVVFLRKLVNDINDPFHIIVANRMDIVDEAYIYSYMKVQRCSR